MFVELSSSRNDLALLARFYERVYDPAFPHADEREPLSRIAATLEAGPGDVSDYHVILALDGGIPVGGSISDYFALAGAGVIEFLAIAQDRRGTGLGRALAEATQQRIEADAMQREGRLRFIGAEVSLGGSSPPFWSALGYRRLDFTYLQPALGPGQAPVSDLALFALPVAPGTTIPAPALRVFLHEYIRYAMRIEEPARCVEYRAMLAQLVRLDAVRLVGAQPARCNAPSA